MTNRLYIFRSTNGSPHELIGDFPLGSPETPLQSELEQLHAEGSQEKHIGESRYRILTSTREIEALAELAREREEPGHGGYAPDVPGLAEYLQVRFATPYTPEDVEFHLDRGHALKRFYVQHWTDSGFKPGLPPNHCHDLRLLPAEPVNAL